MSEYMAGHLVADLDWVDFVFGYSTVSQILLGHMRIRQCRHRSRERWWNSHYQCQPNPGPGPHASPCINNSRITLQVTQFLVQSGTEEVHRGYCTYLAADINILEIRSSQLHCMQ